MDSLSLLDMRHWVQIFDLIAKGTGSMQKICDLVGVHAKWANKLQGRLGLHGAANQLVRAFHSGNTENTALGQELARHFRRVLRRAGKLREPSSRDRKRLVITAAKSAVSPVLGRAFDRYLTLTKVDNVDFDFRAAFSGNVARAVEVGPSRLGIGFNNKSHSHHVLGPEELFTTSFVLAFHRQFKTTADMNIDWKGLANQTVLTYSHESFFNEHINARLPKPQGQGRRVILPSMSQIYKWVHEKRGIAFVLKAFLPKELQRELDCGDLICIDVPRLKLPPVTVSMFEKSRAGDDDDGEFELFKHCILKISKEIREKQKDKCN